MKNVTNGKSMVNHTERISPNKNITTSLFGFYSEQWYISKRLTVKESTLSRYRIIIDRHLYPYFNDIDINQMTPNDIQLFLDKLYYNGYKTKTIGDILSVIKGILKYSTMCGVKIPFPINIISVRTKRTSVEVLTYDEETALCRYLCNNINRRNLGILLSLYTGIRIGELCALKGGDIDLSKRLMYIRRTIIRIPSRSDDNEKKTEILFTSPKTDNSKRVIPLPSEIIELLRCQDAEKGAYFLTGSTEKYVEPRNMQYYFKNVLSKCGISNHKFHSLRHTFATRCIESNMDIKSLSEILGHSGVKITLDCYVHSSLEQKIKEMEKIHIVSFGNFS